MFNRIIEFQNDSNGGTQHLFTKLEFDKLQAWIAWLAITHQHIYNLGENTENVANAIPGAYVRIHDVNVHDASQVPVGFTQINGELFKDGSPLNKTYLNLQDHVTNSDIHPSESSDSSSNQAATGQLVARGWSDPIFVRAAVSAPLFEIMGYTENGPVFMPFPHHNMSPSSSYADNYKNQVTPEALYPSTTPMAISKGDSDPLFEDKIYMKGSFRPMEPSPRQFPYPLDAKSCLDSQFWHQRQQFLYMLPPYLESQINLNQTFDLITGASFNQSNLLPFLHNPLFVDSHHTKLLDRLKRTDIEPVEVLNHKDLYGVFLRDSDKADIFSYQTGTSKTCWLSRYRPMLVFDELSNTSVGCSLFCNDFEQEINQYISQIQYVGTEMRKKNETYYDFPFKVVTIDFNVYENAGEDPRILAYFDGDAEAANEYIAKLGFPRCLYSTDFKNTFAKAGGDLNDEFKPKEEFYFSIYTGGIREYKDWYYRTFGDDIGLTGENPFLYYFDYLNVPHGFTNGRRQVLILKDPEEYRQDKFFKRNPINNLRTQGYSIVEGYVTVPFEIYGAPYNLSDLMSGSEMESAEELPGDDSASDTWKDAPEKDSGSKLPEDTPEGDSPPGGGGGGPIGNSSNKPPPGGGGGFGGDPIGISKPLGCYMACALSTGFYVSDGMGGYSIDYSKATDFASCMVGSGCWTVNNEPPLIPDPILANGCNALEEFAEYLARLQSTTLPQDVIQELLESFTPCGW